jgi:type II secretory pathway pseudopilin PulG
VRTPCSVRTNPSVKQHGRVLAPRWRMRGMGLIEVAIATALLAVVALGVAPLLIGAVRANADARLELDATQAAATRMEQLLTAPFATPVSPPDALATDYAGFSDAIVSHSAILKRRWSVTPLGSDAGLTRVFSVRVITDGRPTLTTITTVRTRTGP